MPALRITLLNNIFPWQARLRREFSRTLPALRIPSSLLTPHSSLLTPHSSLLTPHSSLPLPIRPTLRHAK
ncbi:hypothetical protein [Egbenema bharatensis]|uniref:hypothetical protein n=1 Tax=Egbenema bharatensis TaxID=3463334 RepID=UPI003A8369BB